jgi:hypothetical protein
LRNPIKKNLYKKKAGGVVQGVDPEFNSQYHKKKKKKETGASSLFMSPSSYNLTSKRRWEGMASCSGFLVFISWFQNLSLALLVCITIV